LREDMQAKGMASWSCDDKNEMHRCKHLSLITIPKLLTARSKVSLMTKEQLKSSYMSTVSSSSTPNRTLIGS